MKIMHIYLDSKIQDFYVGEYKDVVTQCSLVDNYRHLRAFDASIIKAITTSTTRENLLDDGSIKYL